MIIVLLVLAITVISLVAGILSYEECEILAIISTVLFIIGMLALLIVGPICLCNNINPESHTAKLEARREAIVYQIENETYLNDNNLGTNELFTQVGEFNADIYAGRIGHKNPWTSWFYGSYYDNVEPIELTTNGGTK